MGSHEWLAYINEWAHMRIFWCDSHEDILVGSYEDILVGSLVGSHENILV